MKTTTRLCACLAAAAIISSACSTVAPLDETPPAPYTENSILYLASRTDLNRELHRPGEVLLVCFTSRTCTACISFAKIYARAATALATHDGIRFLSFLIDHDPSVLDAYDIETIPSTLIFSRGQVIRKLTGPGSYQDLMAIIEQTKDGS